MIFMFTFLLGCADGLRSLTPPALICWAAYLGWLDFSGTRVAFIHSRPTLIIFTLLAVAELIADKLPNTPARTAPLGLIARIVLGGTCGLAVAMSTGISQPISVAVGAMGGFAGAFAGYNGRRFLVRAAHVPDFAVAVLEDVIAIGSGLLILYCIGQHKL